jgi:excinuclease ABC subunit B
VSCKTGLWVPIVLSIGAAAYAAEVGDVCVRDHASGLSCEASDVAVTELVAVQVIEPCGSGDPDTALVVVEAVLEASTSRQEEIMQDLRKGLFDVLVGVNLLREGLDLPEVSLVAILDADKEGFLRSARSLTQTVGRAARHLNGKAIMYADKITKSMQKTIDETNYRREKQIAYNTEHNITPKALNKSLENALAKNSVSTYSYELEALKAAEPESEYLTKGQLEKKIREKRKYMEEAAKALDFLQAAKFRDEIKIYQNKLEKLKV